MKAEESETEESKLGFAKLLGSDPWSWRLNVGKAQRAKEGNFTEGC